MNNKLYAFKTSVFRYILSLFLFFLLTHYALAKSNVRASDAFFISEFNTSELSLLSYTNDLGIYQSSYNVFSPRRMLELALFASGPPIDNRMVTSVENFVSEIASELQGKDDYQKGKIIFERMQQHFLKNIPEQGIPINYDADQSQLSVLLSSSQYNCVSSALLYMILAKYFDLEVEAVIVPSHIFAQLRIGGKIIEVETTTYNGYDFDYNNFFNSSNNSHSDWSRDRGIEGFNINTYHNREIISPIQAILHNMNNQHTSPVRMNEVIRYKLLETRGYLDNTNHDALRGRIVVLHNSLLAADNSNDVSRINYIRNSLSDSLKNENWSTASKEQLYDSLTNSYISEGNTYFENNRWSDAVDSFILSLNYVHKNTPRNTINIIDNNILSSILNWSLEHSNRASVAFNNRDCEGALLSYKSSNNIIDVYIARDDAYVNDKIKLGFDERKYMNFVNAGICFFNIQNYDKSLIQYKQAYEIDNSPYSNLGDYVNESYRSMVRSGVLSRNRAIEECNSNFNVNMCGI